MTVMKKENKNYLIFTNSYNTLLFLQSIIYTKFPLNFLYIYIIDLYKIIQNIIDLLINKLIFEN
jgi:hypothetical protein